MTRPPRYFKSLCAPERRHPTPTISPLPVTLPTRWLAGSGRVASTALLARGVSIVEASPRQDAAVMAETAGSPGADGQKVRMFDTPVNSLTEGLATFQTQTGIKVVIDPARAEGVQVPAVTGRMTLEQALLRHMSHTTYPIRFTAADVATVGLAIAEFVEVSGRALPRSARPVLTDPLEPAS